MVVREFLQNNKQEGGGSYRCVGSVNRTDPRQPGVFPFMADCAASLLSLSRAR
jgi:hypothetical protein